MPNKVNERKKLSRVQQRNLDIEISFLEGVVKRDPGYVEALQILGDDYTQRGKLNQGLHVDQQLARLRPVDPLVHYNLACSLALTERYQEAVDALERALDLGYKELRWLSRDPDLSRLRRHPLYKRIREKLRALNLQTKV